MMTHADIAVSAGRNAWNRLKDRERKSWHDWVAVGHALKLLRDDAMRQTGAKSPHGSKYTTLMASLLASHGLDDIGQQVRHRIIGCVENLPAIETFRAGLSEKQRLKWSHPDSVWWHWKHATGAKARAAPKLNTVRRQGATHVGRRPPAPDQAMIRRVAQAIRENWTNDTFRLAVVAIEAMFAEAAPAGGHAKTSTERTVRSKEFHAVAA